ncbi:MAG: hypothetical protein K5Q00_05145, partial [Gammaproteobacteria bacterium]|nr:hypothetical protein [Gammaproteobacteria bacterium]
MLKTQLSEKIFAPLWQQAKKLITKKSLYHDILLGQKRIRLIFPNRALFSALTASFDHVAIATDLTVAADLTIYIWDADSVKTKAPVLDWDNIFAAGYRGKTFQSIFCQYFEYIRAISLLSYTENVGIYFLKSAKDLPWWVGASPLQVILNNWFKKNGCQLTHAGAIADDKSALILAGSGGAGKSTTVLSCLEHGLNYLSEDYCLLQANEDVPIVHTVYHSAKFEENTLKLFPQYQEHVINNRSSKSEKGLVFY